MKYKPRLPDTGKKIVLLIATRDLHRFDSSDHEIVLKKGDVTWIYETFTNSHSGTAHIENNRYGTNFNGEDFRSIRNPFSAIVIYNEQLSHLSFYIGEDFDHSRMVSTDIHKNGSLDDEREASIEARVQRLEDAYDRKASSTKEYMKATISCDEYELEPWCREDSVPTPVKILDKDLTSMININ